MCTKPQLKYSPTVSTWPKGNGLFSIILFLSFFFFNAFCFLGPHLQYMDVPSLEVKLEPQLPAYTTATTMQDLNHI